MFHACQAEAFSLQRIACGSLLVVLLSSSAFSFNGKQDSVSINSRYLQLETQDDVFVPSPPEGVRTSPAYRFSHFGFFAVQVNVSDSGQNIVGDAANEPSIAVDPTDPRKMSIGWRQFNTISSNFRQAGHAYTTDGGRTWTFPGVLQPGVFRSDPVFDSDAEGNFYYNSLTVVGSDYRCDVFKSTDGGMSWGPGVVAQGGDKQWMTIDKSNSIGEGNIYAFWTSYYSFCPPGSFTRSVTRGASFENCITIPDDPFWGTLAVGPDGELYACGAGDTSFVVAKSTNALDSSQTVVWDTSTSVNLGGDMVAFAGSNSPNPGGLHGQAWVCVDHSGGANTGNVYVLCSVQPFSSIDPLDVMFARSTDGGLAWSSPVRINDDPGNNAWQWFGTMSVAPNGRIDVVWLDTRDNPGSVNSSLYYSNSIDGGVTWSQNQRLSASFDPHLGWPQQNKMGDYYHMVSDDSGASLAWAATFNGEQDVYYGRISVPSTDVSERKNETPVVASLSQNYPNPFNPVTSIQFSIPVSGLTTLKVFDVLGREVSTLVTEVMSAGTHHVTFDASGLASGVYFYRLLTGGFVETKRLIVLR